MTHSEENSTRTRPGPGEYPLDPETFRILGTTTIDLATNREMDKMPAQIINHGAINEVIAGHGNMLNEFPKESIWTGKISLKKRIDGDQEHGIDADPGLKKRVEIATVVDNIEGYFVKADMTARTRCIDGRLLEGWENSLEMQERALGAQVPGGTPLAALSHRLVTIHSMSQNLDFGQDIVSIVRLFKELNLGFGGHIDDHQHEGNTGCGAIDQIPVQLEKLKDPRTQAQLRGLTKAMLNDRYDEDAVDAMIGRAVALSANESMYFSKDEGGVYKYKNTVTDLLRENRGDQDPVAKLTGKHNEVGLVVNFVQDTTFNRDKFNYDNNGDIQLFNFDFWRVEEVARQLYPDNATLTVQKRYENIQKQHLYITTRALLGVAVAMTLTDGSIDLITRTNK